MEIKKEKIEEVNEKSIFFEEVLNKIPVWIVRWGNTCFLLFFIGILLIASYFSYPEVIVADAEITSDHPSIEVYSSTSGVVNKMFFEDQEKVEKGEWVMLVSSYADQNSMEMLKAILDELKKDFWGGIDSITLHENLNLGDLNVEYLSFSQSMNELRLYIEDQPQIKQTRINESRLKHTTNIIKKRETQLGYIRSEIDIKNRDLKRSEILLSRQVISKKDFENKQLELYGKNAQLKELEGQILSMKLQIENINRENEILKLEQNDQYFKLKSALASQFNQLLAAYNRWEKEHVLQAPISGRLNLFDVRNPDQFIQNNQKIFTIVPTENQEYSALLKMPVLSSGNVKPNQEVIIKLFNYPYMEFGTLRGNIETISEVPNENFYTVKVKFPNGLLTNTDRVLEGKQKMNGIAEIITKKKTVLQRFVGLLMK